MTSTADAAVDAAHAGIASAVHNAVRRLGHVLGAAVLGGVMYAGIGSDHDGPLPQALRSGFVPGFRHALAVSETILLVADALVVVLFRGPGR